MNIATIAMSLAVLQEGSIRGAARVVGRSPSTVADAFERFERDLAMTLGLRSEGGFTLTVSGQALARSTQPLLGCLSTLARIAGSSPDEALQWGSRSSVTITILSNFVTVVHTGSIRRASRLLRVAQPYLSRQMSRLEGDLGCSLLQRLNTGCQPTVQGEQLGETAATLAMQVAGLTAPAERRFARSQRVVKLGTIIPIGHESRLASRLAALVATWRRELPAQDLLVGSTTAEDLIAGLRSGRYDVALMDMPLQDRRFQSLEIFSSELVLVGRSEILDGDGSLVALLQAHQIAVPSLRSGLRQRIRGILDPLLQDMEDAAGLLVEVDALSIIVNLIVEHGYLSILPLDAVRSLEGDIGIVRLPGAPQIGFHLTWSRTAAANALAKRLGAFLSDQAELVSRNLIEEGK